MAGRGCTVPRVNMPLLGEREEQLCKQGSVGSGQGEREKQLCKQGSVGTGQGRGGTV